MESLSYPSLDYLFEAYKSIHNLSKRLQEKMDLFNQTFAQSPINKQLLSSLCYPGIPDEIKGLRSICWRLILNYLPTDKNKWQDILAQNRKDYDSFVQQFLVFKNKEKVESKQDSNSLEFVKPQDHPLSKSKESDWNALFKDLELWDEIEKDTRRTRSEMSFFLEKTDPPSNYPLLCRYVPKDHRFTSRSEKIYEDRPEIHCDVMTRILFLYAKLNPGVRYVQGMNEILAPIYYCFAGDKAILFKDNIETDSFFCFNILMGEIRDGFIRSLDDSSAGIKARMQNFADIFECFDKELSDYFNEIGIKPQFYCLRWLMLLLTQEFQISDVMRLWDALLSHPERLGYLNFVCLALIQNQRENLIKSDFAGIMGILQNLEGTEINKVLNIANKIYKEAVEDKTT